MGDDWSVTDELAYSEILDRVGELAEQALGRADASVRADVEELVDWLDVFHREGLGRFVEMVREWRGELFLEQVALDPVVGELLRTYDLGVDVDASLIDRTVQLALDDVRPYVHSHGGDVEVLGIADGVVRLRMVGHCDGCTAADQTVSLRIEQAIRDRWVDFRRVEVEDATAAPHPPPRPEQIVTGIDITSKGA